MALTRITKGVIKPNENYDTHNINSTGVVTATKFVGPFDDINVSGAATFTGNVTIGGTLTYEDVTNIDSVGLITARNGAKIQTGTATTALVVEGNARVTGILTVGTGSITLNETANTINVGTALTLGHTQGLQFHTQNLHSAGFEVNQVNASGIITATGADIDDFVNVGNNIKLGNAGVITATSFSGSGANLTGIDATAIKDTGGNVKIQAQASGAVYTGIHTFNSGVEVGSNIKLGNAGVITATSFVGDGSDLTNLPAGLGTALSATASSPLNKMYYTNQVLGVPSSVTVDVPASSSKAYTQYADIKVESNADLIVAEGDDLIPDILGLADFGTFGGGASAGRIRVNSISNASNDGAPTVQKGLIVAGVTTSNTFSGNITGNVTGNISGTTGTFGDFVDVGSNIKLGNAGVITATSFSGDGSNLSNLPASAPVGGASTNSVFFENDVAVAVNYQITSNKNAMSAGPIAINAGIAVTVPSGSSWTIV